MGGLLTIGFFKLPDWAASCSAKVISFLGAFVFELPAGFNWFAFAASWAARSEMPPPEPDDYLSWGLTTSPVQGSMLPFSSSAAFLNCWGFGLVRGPEARGGGGGAHLRPHPGLGAVAAVARAGARPVA